MNFLKRWVPFLFGLVGIYFLGYLYQYDFGFGLRINNLMTELVHFTIFAIFGLITCHSICKKGKITRPHFIYALGIMFFISVIGVFNEVRIHPEHGGGNVRDIFFHLSASILGIIIWRLIWLIKNDVV